MIAPNPSDFINHRLKRMRVEHHQPQGEIRCHKGEREHPKRKSDQQKLQCGENRSQLHPAAAAQCGSQKRNDCPKHRKTKRDVQTEMSEFIKHKFGIVAQTRLARNSARI